MNVPQLRFKGFNEEWEVKKIKDVANVNPNNNNSLPKRFQYIDLESVKQGRLINTRIINIDEAPSRAQRIVMKNDILFQMVRPYQKNNYFVNKEVMNTVASTGYALLRANKNINPLFIYAHILNKNFVNQVLIHCTGSNYPAITSNDLANIYLKVPTYEEQRKIGQFFNKLDNLISLHTKRLELLKNKRDAYLQKLFPKAGQTTPQLRFKGFSKEWQSKKLNDLIVKIIDNRGKTPPLDNNGNYALIEVNALINGKVNFDKVSKFVNKNTYDSWFRNHLKKDDILFSTVGNTGLTAIYEGNRFACVAQNIVGLRFNVNKYFMLANLENKNNIKKFKAIEMQAVQPSIKVTQLIKLKITITENYKEQQKIGSLFAKLDHLIDLQNHKLQLLQELKKGYLQKMFV